ncbi:MAG: hypothetical protein ABI120_20385 [Gemmatimonadaceae bacterium]
MNDSQSGSDDFSGSNTGANGAPEHGSPEHGAEDSAAPAADSRSPRQSFKRRHWGKLLLLTLVMFPVAAFGIWSAVTLGWTYSEGDRPGFVQKIAIKGYLCKTWEGVLYNDLQCFRADSFQFTVRSDSLAKVLQGLTGKQVSLHYQQHVNVPSSCFGDSEYFVSGVRELK